ncbi:MAG: hypothetical protein PVH83_09990 [Methyloceanibacter sp.]|jgi:hypothetical protein
MIQLSDWIEQWGAVTNDLSQAFILYVPHLVGAIVVLFLGWAVARLGQIIVTRLAGTLNRVFGRLFAKNQRIRIRLTDGAINVVGGVVFWVIIVLALTAAAKIAKLDVFAQWLDRMLAYLPSLLAGGLIAFIGYLAAKFIRDIVTVTFSMVGTERAQILGIVAQSATFLVAIVVGLDQAGIDVGFIITLVGILVAAIAASFALAFALGSQTFVANLIGVYQMQNYLRPGQEVRLDDVQGEILDLSTTSVVLATEKGRVLLPGRLLSEETLTLLTPDSDDDQQRD